MRIPICGVLVALAGSVLIAQTFPPGYVDPAPMLAAASREIGEANLKLHHVLGHRLRRRGRAGVRVGASNIDWPRIDCAGQLHADDQLRDANDQGRVRSQARTESRVVEIRPRLAGRHAAPEEPASDVRRQRQRRLAHGRRRRGARRDVARRRRARTARNLDEPARLPQGRAAAGRESESDLAVGARRNGPRRSDDRAGENACRVDHDGEVSASTRPSTSGTRSSASTRWSPSRRSATSTTSTSRPISRRSAPSSGRPRGTRTRDGTTTSASTTSAPATTRSAARSRTCQPNVCGESVPVPESVRQAQFGRRR